MVDHVHGPRVAEFFAGIGLVRLALEDEGFHVVWANDIKQVKMAMYQENFGDGEFLLGDVRIVTGSDIPDCDVATASFPCQDLSLAGNRAGLAGGESSMFWEFSRVLKEMDDRRPPIVVLENVPGFATSNSGEDLREAIRELNRLGYVCDIFVVNAKTFVPQSRERLFIVGVQKDLVRAKGSSSSGRTPSKLRPAWIQQFAVGNPDFDMQAFEIEPPEGQVTELAEIVEHLHWKDDRWWGDHRKAAFVSSLSRIQTERLRRMMESRRLTWATAFRRTRNRKAVWEIRDDSLSGCLRTARGGSSRQAIVEAGYGRFRIRWMTAREYARLQGVPDEYSYAAVTETQAKSGFGDAVCVPVISWIAARFLHPLLKLAVTEDG